MAIKNKSYLRVLRKLRKLHKDPLSRCNRPDLTVACILDSFSYECFRYECNLIQLDAASWQKQLKGIKPDFLFVESAWQGIRKSWKGKIRGQDPKVHSRIRQLVKYCKEHRIPTVFWNKEDPPHFGTFLETAKLFDVIFTTDANSVEPYKMATGNKRVYVLPFAAQPAIHNPIGSSREAKGNVAFAGTYYSHRYPERKADMDIILPSALSYNLHIYDRNYRSKDKRLQFPNIYKRNVLGGLRYIDMVKAYKLYKVFLNINTVKDSPTMFARRVFELLASGTNVISTYSKGMVKMFPQVIQIADTPETADLHLNRLLNNRHEAERLSLLGIRSVYSNHLYKHRFAAILSQLGIRSPNEPGVTVITILQHPGMIANALRNFRTQTWKRKEWMLITFDPELFRMLQSLFRFTKDISVQWADSDMPLDGCVRSAMHRAKYEFISIFTDYNFYAPNFLTDLMHAFLYTDAEIVGKGCYFKYLNHERISVICQPRYEHTYTDNLSPEAWIMKKETASGIRFPDDPGIDFTRYLKLCAEAGYKMYSADKYNFLQMDRSAPVIGHSLVESEMLVTV